jgi:hypothetical protein
MATIEQRGADLKVTLDDGRAFRVKGATAQQAAQWLSSKGIKVGGGPQRQMTLPGAHRLIQRAPSPLAPGIGGMVDQPDEMLSIGP